MNKSDLVAAVAKKNGLSVKITDEVISDFLDSIVSSIQANDDVAISGFGIFKGSVSPAHDAVNPKDRSPIKVPEKRKMSFTLSSTVKKILNPGK